MKTLTVVEDQGPYGPKSWNEAALICTSQIFQFAELMERSELTALDGGLDQTDPILSIFDQLNLLDAHFDGMVNTGMSINVESMYWVSEWRILGAIAAHIANCGGFFNLFESSRPGPQDAIFSQFRGVDLNVEAGKRPEHRNHVKIARLLCRKQRDYGKHAIERFGRRGLLVRCHDKIARLKNLSLRTEVPNNESLSDTYVDIVGYAAIGMMLERGWFSLPLED